MKLKELTEAIILKLVKNTEAVSVEENEEDNQIIINFFLSTYIVKRLSTPQEQPPLNSNTQPYFVSDINCSKKSSSSLSIFSQKSSCK